jgi:hypothetical protein
MLSENKQTFTLPEDLRMYFWDVEFDLLTFEKYPRFITERILNYGNPLAIKWLLSITTNQYIKSVVKKSRNMNAKTRNYWQLILP